MYSYTISYTSSKVRFCIVVGDKSSEIHHVQSNSFSFSLGVCFGRPDCNVNNSVNKQTNWKKRSRCEAGGRLVFSKCKVCSKQVLNPSKPLEPFWIVFVTLARFICLHSGLWTVTCPSKFIPSVLRWLLDHFLFVQFGYQRPMAILVFFS